MKTRRKFICDIVEKYKQENPEDYSNFLDLVEYRRLTLNDKKNSVLTGQKEMRLAVTIPQKLLNQLMFVLDGVNEERFLEEKGEMKWFVKKFPIFLIPNQY